MKVYVNVMQEIEIPDHFQELVDYDIWDEKTMRPLHNELCKTIESIMQMPLSSSEAAKTTDKSIESVYTTDWQCLIET
jgi:hypothetical protein